MKLSNFYVIAARLILLTYFSVYLALAQVYSYGFNINIFNTVNVLLIRYFDFCCYAFNLKRTLQLESGDMEINPGRMKPFIKFCHWDLNGLAAHDFVKILLIEAFRTTHNIIITCLSETFLDSNIDISDTRMNIDGYSILKADHPSNTKCSGVRMY